MNTCLMAYRTYLEWKADDDVDNPVLNIKKSITVKKTRYAEMVIKFCKTADKVELLVKANCLDNKTRVFVYGILQNAKMDVVKENVLEFCNSTI